MFCARSRAAAAAITLAFLAWSGAAAAQDKVQFPSHDDNGAGQVPTLLDGYLFRVKGPEPHPAVVFMHGCWGLFDGQLRLEAVERQWQRRLNAAGYNVLAVDGNSPRGIKENCSEKSFSLGLFLKRANDAYGALTYLQAQPYIEPDAVALMGWASGGGAVLLAIGKDSAARPAALPKGDFRAAVALYPAICDDRFQVAPWTATATPTWTTNTPLLILDGGKDVWTPAKTCAAFVAGARDRGAAITLKIYPEAYHAFDVPALKPVRFPAYSQPDNVVPILGTDPDARADALNRVPEFLAKNLGK
jgi:dienelactone hydrolase